MLPPSAPLWRAALLGRCPRCGKGRLFSGLLDVRPSCEVCGLDLRGDDSGDGAAVFAIFIVGTIVVVAAFVVEFRLSPPLWVHVVLWPLVTVPLTIAVIRPVKAVLVAMQYRYRTVGLSGDGRDL